jgi:hypothetical protein
MGNHKRTLHKRQKCKETKNHPPAAMSDRFQFLKSEANDEGAKKWNFKNWNLNIKDKDLGPGNGWS